MILKKQKEPLVLQTVPLPTYEDSQLLVKVHACGVCRTDLHIKEGELPQPKLPLILGHEIVGTVEAIGKNVTKFHKGERVGIPWLAKTCGHCEACKEKNENLCENALFTGYHVDGGFAEYTVCEADFAIPLTSTLSDAHVAPLLCAGLIGYRAYQKAAPAHRLGLYGFGASAHIIAQLALHEGKEIYAFTREADEKGQQFAKELGVHFAASSTTLPPKLLDAAILFAPVGALVPQALQAIKKGGRCICAGIHMSDIPSFPYALLWGEKTIASVANLTRKDADAFFSLSFPVKTKITTYPLEKADTALEDLKKGSFQGAAVILL